MAKRVGRAVQLALICLLAVILLSNLYTMAARVLRPGRTPTVFGFSWAVVVTGSMEPEISGNDLIVTLARSHYQVDDIVMYETGGVPITHRIVGRTDNGFITQGDANNAADTAPVAPEQIVGKVLFAIPKVGVVLGWLKTPAGLLSVVLIGAVLIEGPYLLKKCRKERENGKNPKDI